MNTNLKTLLMPTYSITATTQGLTLEELLRRTSSVIRKETLLNCHRITVIFHGVGIKLLIRFSSKKIELERSNSSIVMLQS